MGISLGSGFAAYAAQKYGTKTVILVAPYSSLKAIARTRPIVGYFWPLMWNEVASETYISQLKETCVVDLHGTLDRIIPLDNSQKLQRAYRGTGRYQLIIGERSGHNDIFWNTQEKIVEALQHCTKQADLLV